MNHVGKLARGLYHLVFGDPRNEFWAVGRLRWAAAVKDQRLTELTVTLQQGSRTGRAFANGTSNKACVAIYGD